ncbi:hypothetical protein [Rubellimicrobium mesophilum]|uniref:hypothetical protein n=1 Tax=Rubellimicrobium mesophilum TaxID=1123067 RepID=UPI00055BD12A|nr:hypothetical protein [Rubellimicrobium mesophilum]
MTELPGAAWGGGVVAGVVSWAASCARAAPVAAATAASPAAAPPITDRRDSRWSSLSESMV